MGHGSKNWKNTTQLLQQLKFILTHLTEFPHISGSGRDMGNSASKGVGVDSYPALENGFVFFLRV